MTSLWHADTIKDVSEAVGIANLSDDVAKNLAMDVEYRIHQVLQEALKFMKHAKRTVLTTADISHALRVLDVEPLYGYDTTRPIRFAEASLGPGQPMFYVEDDEIDFEKLVNAPLPKVPREVSMTGRIQEVSLRRGANHTTNNLLVGCCSPLASYRGCPTSDPTKPYPLRVSCGNNSQGFYSQSLGCCSRVHRLHQCQASG